MLHAAALSLASSVFLVAERRPLAFLGLAAIGLYWVGTHLPLPGVNTGALAPVAGHGVLGLYDLFSGGNLGGTIFALGIMPDPARWRNAHPG